MIRQVIDDINKYVDYSFKDTHFGLVYPVLNKTQKVPGSRDGFVYKDAIPNDSKKSIVYWEDYGSTTILNAPRYKRMESTVRLVIWMNFKKIGSEKTYDECVMEILQAIPNKVTNKIHIILRGEVPKTENIFGRYDYRETKQYVAPPFDVACFEFSVRYMLPYCQTETTPTI